MNYYVSVLNEASKIVFQRKIYVFGALLTSFFVFVAVITVPLLTVPGNDLAFQLSIMPLRDYVTISILGMLTGISLMFNLYVFRRERKQKIEKVGTMSITGGIGVVSSFFGSVTCVACASSILGFLGLGTVTFLLSYRLPIVLLSSFFIILSIYFTSRKILNLCDVCTIKK